MKPGLPDEETAYLKKRNRIRKLSPKPHKVVHESGRSTKNLWMKIVERARSAKSRQKS